MPDPMVLVVMGVSGSGKSTVAELLARRLGWVFVDGDDFHTPEHIARMHTGHALDDADRKPWLALIRAWIDARLAAGTSGVIVCSALRRSYRDALVQDRPDIRIVYLEGSRALIGERLKRRRGHFMPAELLDSQFAALEPPGPEERPITVGIDDGPDAVAAAIAIRLGVSQAS
ncbi:gluconokinase [Methylobacterium sp. WL9]|uniref:gluconokinase n=1 Tax=Methylobacterium sp. WL9 TaxID=2603898 RepID=UPI0011C974F5|nr:gluconokinase [Methylobacterium sp. WL9]TXN20890.1 gluconokinase [Methylobacterium sp. WL9]